jgi:hypothetical protein
MPPTPSSFRDKRNSTERPHNPTGYLTTFDVDFINPVIDELTTPGKVVGTDDAGFKRPDFIVTAHFQVKR